MLTHVVFRCPGPAGPPDGTDYYGRCLGACWECGEHLLCTGRYTVYCPACDRCPECGCPAADGFRHYADCPLPRCDDCGSVIEEPETSPFDDDGRCDACAALKETCDAC